MRVTPITMPLSRQRARNASASPSSASAHATGVQRDPAGESRTEHHYERIIDDEVTRCHPSDIASATTRDTSCFSSGKSTGLVTNLLAPRSSAAFTLSASP